MGLSDVSRVNLNVLDSMISYCFKVHIIQKNDGLFPVFQSSHGSTVGKSIAQAQCDHLGKHLPSRPCHPKRWPWNNSIMESWHLEGCLPLVAPLTCGNDRTLKDHISKYQCICLSLLVIIPHHLSISFLVFAAPIDYVHDHWLQSNGHPHIHIWLSSKRSIFTLIASQATESNRIQSKFILQRSQKQALWPYSSCSSYATAREEATHSTHAKLLLWKKSIPAPCLLKSPKLVSTALM